MLAPSISPSPDPLADQYPGWSPYVYALNNPLRYNDPTGLCPADPENDIECIEGGELGEVVVTAQRPRSGGSFSFATFAPGATSVGGQALVRTPHPYAVGAGVILLFVADHFIGDVTLGFEMPDEMVAKAQQDPFKDIDMTDVKTWPAPPTDLPVEEGAPSRKKAKERGEKSLWDSPGGEWRPHKPDKYHPQGHWDYKPPGTNTPWRNIYIK